MLTVTTNRYRDGVASLVRLWSGVAIIGALCFLGFFPSFITLSHGGEADISLRLLPPNSIHPLGCDLYGQDILNSILMGARTSLIIGFLTVFFSTCIGVVAGLVAGFFRGIVDHVIMRLVEIVMAFPGILLAMALAALLGPSLMNLVLAMTATGWTGIARLVRAEVLSLSSREYVMASQVLGASTGRILFRQIMPSLWPYVLVTSSFSFAGVIITEASLGFLGLGAPDGYQTWGSLLNQGRTVILEAPHLSLFPGIVLVLVVLGFNFVGDGLRDKFDPKAT